MGWNRQVWWLASALASLLAGCAAERATPQGEASGAPSVLSEDSQGRLQSALEGCTVASGYDPESAEVQSLGEYVLADGELAFRDCAYEALNEIVRPSLRLPALLDELIAADRQMTGAIPLGGISRSQRSTANDEKIALIREQETAIRAAEMPAGGGSTMIGALDHQRQERELTRFRDQMDVVNRLF